MVGTKPLTRLTEPQTSDSVLWSLLSWVREVGTGSGGEPIEVRGLRVLDLALWVMPALLLWPFLDFCLHAATRASNGFVAYYTAARLLSEGADVSRFYDDAWFVARVAERAPAIYDLFSPNPPTTALLLLPFAGLDYTGARLVWTALNLVGLLVGLFWLLRALNLPRLYGRLLVTVLLLYQPLYSSLFQGQVYLLLLGLLAVAWHGYRRGANLPLGLSLGLMMALKMAAAPLLLLLLVQRRWLAMLWATATMAGVSIASLPWLGLESWRTYLPLLPSLSTPPEIAATAYQSLSGFVHHIGTNIALWSGALIPQSATLASLLTVFGCALLVALSARRAWGRSDSDAAFSLFVATSLIVSPLSVDYHYPLALLPIALLLPLVVGRASRWPLILLGVATILLAADLPYQSPRLAVGAWALLAYPKLYGVALLWGLAFWASGDSRQHNSGDPLMEWEKGVVQRQEVNPPVTQGLRSGVTERGGQG